MARNVIYIAMKGKFQMENNKANTIETYIYHKDVINNVISILRTIKVEGYEQAQLLTEIARLICSPLQEGTTAIDTE